MGSWEEAVAEVLASFFTVCWQGKLWIILVEEEDEDDDYDAEVDDDDDAGGEGCVNSITVSR